MRKNRCIHNVNEIRTKMNKFLCFIANLTSHKNNGHRFIQFSSQFTGSSNQFPRNFLYFTIFRNGNNVNSFIIRKIHTYPPKLQKFSLMLLSEYLPILEDLFPQYEGFPFVAVLRAVHVSPVWENLLFQSVQYQYPNPPL